MSYNYEQSIWGTGEAGLKWSDPTAFRLRQAVRVVDETSDREEPWKVGEVDGLGGTNEASETLKVLELGCGAGQFIRAIKKLCPTCECHGVDISKEALSIARNTHDDVLYELSEESRLPYADLSFDTVFIFDVLEHVENPSAIVSEVHRILKPEGIFYAFVPCEGDLTSMWNFLEFIHLKRNLTKKHAGHINYFSRKTLLALFKELGFKVVRIRYSEHFLGQILGIMAFYLMDRAAKRQGMSQINNETYFKSNENKAVKKIKNIVNSLVYFESWLLQLLPSPNVHVVLKK